MIEIGVKNFSHIVSDDEVGRWTMAIAKQLQEYGAIWRCVPPSLTFYPEVIPVPPGCGVIAVFDDADQSNFLGWHSTTPDGGPYGKVFVKPCGDYPVSAVLSHEVLELAADPPVNRWADTGTGYSIAWEICDPVEGDIYDIDGVHVSNFVTPAWFDNNASEDALFDRCAKCVAPFELLKGGYLVHRVVSTGTVEAVWGSHVAAFRKQGPLHPMSRGIRRGACPEGTSSQ